MFTEARWDVTAVPAERQQGQQRCLATYSRPTGPSDELEWPFAMCSLGWIWNRVSSQHILPPYLDSTLLMGQVSLIAHIIQKLFLCLALELNTNSITQYPVPPTAW